MPSINSVKLVALPDPEVQPPVITVSMGADGMIMSWDTGVAFDVLTNATLMYGDWGVYKAAVSSPVTNTVGDESQLFFKLQYEE